MKIVYNFKLSKKYELKNKDLEKIFNQYKNYIKNELELSYSKKYGYNLPEFNLNFNEISFNDEIDKEIKKNLIDLNFNHKPELKLLKCIIDNEKYYDEDFLTKININFE